MKRILAAIVIGCVLMVWGHSQKATSLETRRAQPNNYETRYWNEGILYRTRGEDLEVISGRVQFNRGNTVFGAGFCLVVGAVGLLVYLRNSKRDSSVKTVTVFSGEVNEKLLRGCLEALDECTRAREFGHRPGKGFVAWLAEIISEAEGHKATQVRPSAATKEKIDRLRAN